MGTIRLDELQQRPELSEAAMALKPGSMRLDDALDATNVVPVHKDDLDLTKVAQWSDERIAQAKRQGPIGAFEHNQRMDLAPRIPGGMIAEATSAITFKRASERLQKNDYQGNEALKEKDIETFKTFLDYRTEQQVRGMTWGAHIWDSVSQMPSFMAEMFATASIAGSAVGATALGARVVATAAAKQGIKSIAAKGALWAAGGAVRAGTVGVPRIVESSFRRESELNLIPTDKGFQLQARMQSAPFSSFAGAIGETWLTYFSEEAGKVVFDPLLQRAAGASFVAPFMKRMVEAYKKIPGAERVGKLFTQAGWDGFVSEMGEEFFEREMQALLNVDDFGVKEGNPLDRMIAAIPDGEEMAIMMGALAVPGVARVGAISGLKALDVYREGKRRAGLEDKFKTYKQDIAKTFAQSILQKNYDVVENTVAEAQQPLPQMELSRQDLEQLKVSTRGEKAGIEESKPIPERAIPEDIVNTVEFKQADREKQVELLMRGRLAKLDQQRTEIEARMDRLEGEVRNLNKIERPDVVILSGKQQELMQLSKELLSIHSQIADTIDAVPEELQQQQLLLPGESLGQIGKLARQVGARMERGRVETVFRNEKAQAEERRVALVKYLQARIPGPENSALREKYLLRAAKGMTEKKLQEMFKDIEGKRDVVRAKQLRAKANEIVEKFKPTIEDGVKKGRFVDPALQRIADKVLSFVHMDKDTAENALRQRIEEITALIEKGDGESETAEDLKFEAGLIAKVSGLESRNTDQLEDAIQVLTRILNDLQVGRDTTTELRKAQRKAEYAAIAGDITKTHATPKTIAQKLATATYKGIVKIYSFNTFHLAEYWRELSGGKETSWIKKLLLAPLERIPAYRAALQQKMTRPMRRAIQEIYGVGQTNNGEFYKWMTARMSLDKSTDDATAPFLKEVTLNNGRKKNLRMSRFDVMYWYALAYQEEGIIDPEAYEILTGENQLAGIRNQVETQHAENEEIDIDAEVDRRAAEELKGNAIPSDVLDNMFGMLTEKDKKFALQMRKIFSSFWPLINPVYARATGVDMTRVDNYIPWLRNTSQTKNVEDLLGEMALIESHVTPFPGSVKERRKTSTAPFAQVGLLEVFQGFQTTMSHWVASRDITARMQGYLRNKAIRTAINQATDGTYDASREEWRDGDYIKAMEFHLKGIVSQGRTDNNIEMPLMRVLRRNLSRFFLIKPKQFLVQITSAASAIIKIGEIKFLRGVASYFRDPQGANELMNRAMSLHNRHRNIMVEMKEVQDLLRQGKRTFADRFNWLDRYGFIFTQAGDRASIGLAGWAIFKDAYDKTKSVEKAYKEFDDFVFNLQQSALREHQTAGTVGPYRYFFQFISAVAQYGRAYHRAFADVVRDPSPKNMKVWARTMVVFHVYIPYMMWLVANIGVPPPEDEDEEEKKLKQLQFMMLTGPFSGLWVLGHVADFTAQAITGQRGFEAGAPVIQYMNQTKDALNKALRVAIDEDAEPEEISDAVWRAGKTISGLTMGMPSWFNNDVQALYQHTMGEWDASSTPGLLYGHSVEMLNRRNK